MAGIMGQAPPPGILGGQQQQQLGILGMLANLARGISNPAGASLEAGTEIGPPNPGRMYEVDIDASPDEFLDWDKPLSEQPPRVQEVIKSLVPEAEQFKKLASSGGSLWSELERPGFQSTQTSGPRGAAEALRAAGIKGIRYKDAGSRKLPSTPAHDVAQEWLRGAKGNIDEALAAYDQHVSTAIPTHLRDSGTDEIRDAIRLGGRPEQQTHNYVVFDDSTINILKKYGIAGLTGGGAGLGILGGSQDASAAQPSYRTGGGF